MTLAAASGSMLAKPTPAMRRGHGLIMDGAEIAGSGERPYLYVVPCFGGRGYLCFGGVPGGRTAFAGGAHVPLPEVLEQSALPLWQLAPAEPPLSPVHETCWWGVVLQLPPWTDTTLLPLSQSRVMLAAWAWPDGQRTMSVKSADAESTRRDMAFLLERRPPSLGIDHSQNCILGHPKAARLG